MKDHTRHFYREVVQATVERIAGRLDEALDLAELARTACLSALHFHRIFRGMLGETPLELHRRLRLERAALQLATSETAVTVIAFEAGFETHESFTRAFQAAYALAPTQFRKRMNQHRERMAFPDRVPFELPARNGIHFDQAGGVRDMTVASGESAMEVDVEDMQALRLAVVTHHGPRNMVGEAFGRLASIAGPAGLLTYPGAMMVAVFHDDPETTPAADLRTSAGVIVPGQAQVPPSLSELHIQAGKYARATHRGHYVGLSDAWDRMMGQWLPTSIYRVDDNRLSYEAYRIADHSRPDSLETDLYLAIA
jgi:AraC family transcriptional regulator